ATLHPGATPTRRRLRGGECRDLCPTVTAGRAGLVNSYLVYRASFYLMLTVATLALSGDTSESRFAQFYPVVVSLAGVVAFLTVDRQSRFALSRTMANGLALLTLGILYFEYRFDDTQLVRSLGHWLVYLQLIKYFLPK